MLCVEGLVNLVEQVERGWVTLLNGKDERESDERLLSARQLLHVSHLRTVTRERHLQHERHLVSNHCKANSSVRLIEMFTCHPSRSGRDTDGSRISHIPRVSVRDYLKLTLLKTNSSAVGVEWIYNRASVLHPVVDFCHRDPNLLVPFRNIVLPAIPWPSLCCCPTGWITGASPRGLTAIGPSILGRCRLRSTSLNCALQDCLGKS